MIKQIKKSYYAIGSALTVGLFTANQAIAQQNTIDTITTSVTESLNSLPGLVATVTTIAGLVVGIMGIFKIKDHVEEPGKNPLKDGAIRLAVGGALLAMPFMYDLLMGTLGAADAGTAPTSLKFEAAGSGLK